MVNISIPRELSEEEKELQKKFALLKSRKKLLASLKTPKAEAKEASESKKRAQEDAAGNTEQAKKLLKLGAIKVGEKKEGTPQTFKRSKRQKESEKANVSFQPFSPTATDTDSSPPKPSQKYKSLYDNFVTTSDVSRSKPSPDRKPSRFSSPPKPGNTLYVDGGILQEESVTEIFRRIGKIKHVNIDKRKSGHYFITYEEAHHATQALKELDAHMVEGVRLRVQWARRQPRSGNKPDADDLSAENWAHAAGADNQNDIGAINEQREAVTYEEEMVYEEDF